MKDEKIQISNPDKILWKDLGIRKVDYINIMYKLSEYLIKYSKNRLLTSIRYPDGIDGKSFYQKNIPAYTPKWINTAMWKDNQYVNLDKVETLIWLANQAVLEFHTSFNLIELENKPTSLVFDLDPSKGQSFEDVTEVALIIYDNLKELNIKSFVKTSGSSGVQILIPTSGNYDYISARAINEFFANYFSKKYPNKITMERLIKKRGSKLYFDYLQMWQGKTIITPYSPRANEKACISTPLDWEELKKGVNPTDFTLKNIIHRLEQKGDLLSGITEYNNKELDNILNFAKKEI